MPVVDFDRVGETVSSASFEGLASSVTVLRDEERFQEWWNRLMPPEEG
jgi:hypothetical protein